MEKRAMALFITTCILPHLDVVVNQFFAFLRKKCGGKGAGEAGEVPRKTEGLNPLSRGKPRQLPLMQSRGADPLFLKSSKAGFEGGADGFQKREARDAGMAAERGEIAGHGARANGIKAGGL